ncbi:MAG: prepilin-type N-terminal cleavage/methylation domain-containing protein [Candidatus Uhrbacteria bacterium]
MNKRHDHSGLTRRGFIQHHFWRKSGAGFTLLETIIALAAFAIITTVIASVLVFEIRLRVTAQAEQDTGIAVANALQTITKAIEPAATVLVSATVRGQLITSDEQTIAFGVPTVDINGEIRGTQDTVAISFDQSRKIIELSTDPAAGSRLPASKRTIGRNIQALRFRYPTANPTDARAVHVLVVAETRGAQSRTMTREAGTIVALQNKTP